MSTPSARLTKAFGAVLETIAAREGVHLPSREVISNAAKLNPAAISQHVGWHRLYHVRGSKGIEYAVILHMETTASDAPIIDAECTCDAGRSGKVCKHLLRILAHAHLDGHVLAS